jgi:hypothetical protein
MIYEAHAYHFNRNDSQQQHVPFVVAYIGGKKRFNIITEIFKFNSKEMPLQPVL